MDARFPGMARRERAVFFVADTPQETDFREAMSASLRALVDLNHAITSRRRCW
jgi:hypothetical protein